MTALEKVRMELNEEIEKTRQSEMQLVDLFSKGRLNGLLYVRDRILFNAKED